MCFEKFFLWLESWMSSINIHERGNTASPVYVCVVPFLLLFSQFPQRLSACLTQATKDPDPFHQLFEQRKGDLTFVWCLIWWECVVEYIVVHMMEYVVVPKVMKYLTKHSRCLDVITGLVYRWSATDNTWVFHYDAMIVSFEIIRIRQDI